MVQIKWLKEAKADLKEIFVYISLDSKRYARLQVERIQQSTKILKLHPNIGKIVDEIDNPEIREIVEGNYRIIYRIVNKKDFLIQISHHDSFHFQLY